MRRQGFWEAQVVSHGLNVKITTHMDFSTLAVTFRRGS